MEKTENKYITVAYKLYVTDEKENIKDDLVEECNEEHPFLFLSGMGQVLPAFESNVENIQEGDNFDFVIPCEQAYGPFDEQLMFDVSKDIFCIDGKFDKEHIYEGAIVPLQSADGHQFNGIIIQIKEDAVTVDLNHPRAGEDLHFVGKVVTNRPATEDEVSGMKAMMSHEGGCCCGCDHCEHDGCDGHHHDGCDCGCH